MGEKEIIVINGMKEYRHRIGLCSYDKNFYVTEHSYMACTRAMNTSDGNKYITFKRSSTIFWKSRIPNFDY